MASRKCFIGSLFGFHKPDELIQQLEDTASDADAVPFITYDQSAKLFCWDHADPDETQPTTHIVEQFSAYLSKHQSKCEDLVASPRLKPIDGTSIREPENRSSSTRNTQNLVFDYESSSEEDSSAGNVPGLISAYWKPKDAGIDILTPDVVTAVSNATGCDLYPEPSNERVKLINGDLKAGLQMLQNLEHLLKLIKRHKANQPASLNANITVSMRYNAELFIKLVPLEFTHPGTDRIVLPTERKTLITQILVAEARYRNHDALEIEIPLNLDLEGVRLVDGCERSHQFSNNNMPLIGDETSVTSKPVKSVSNYDPITKEMKVTYSKFLAPTDANRLTEWTKSVDPEADPELGHSVPQPEPDEVNDNRRRIVVDSDSDLESVDRCEPIPYHVSTAPEADNTTQTSVIDIAEQNVTTRDNVQERSTSCAVPTVPTGSLSEHQQVEVPPDDLSQYPNFGELTFSHKNKFDLLETSPGDEISEFVSSVSSDPKAKTNTTLQHRGYSQQHRPRPYPPKFDKTSSDSLGQVLSGPRKTESTPKRTDGLNSRGFEHRHNPRHASISPSKGNKRSSGHYGGAVPPAKPIPIHHTAWTETSSNMEPSPSFVPAKYASEQLFKDPSTSEMPLIDISSSSTTKTAMLPPPGFHYRSEPSEQVKSANYLDSDPDLKSGTALVAAPAHSASNRGQSDSGSNMSVPSPLNYVPRPIIRKRDIRMLEQRTAAHLKKTMDASSHVPGHNPIDSEKTISPPRLHKERDSPPKMHQTMGQKAPKGTRPAFNKSTAPTPSQETKKERDARIAKAKADAYGDTTPELPVSSSKSQIIQVEPISARKAKLIKPDVKLVSNYPEQRREQTIREQVKDLIRELEPLFEASRAFAGNVNFEIQLGQALIIRNNSLNTQLLKPKDWAKIFHDEGAVRTESIFTNIVTGNGLEIDRFIQMKGFGGHPKLWSDRIDPPSTIIEFMCLNRSGEDFVIMVSADSTYKIMQLPQIIGKVALHYVGQVWDACSTLQGQREWDSHHHDIATGTQQLVESLYIPAKATAEVHFRQPLNGAFEVRSVNVRQHSFKKCSMPGYESHTLKITEFKKLIRAMHPEDKKLCMWKELDFERMASAGRLYYEIALTCDEIDTALAMHNSVLEIGSLTLAHETGANLITFERIRKMIDLLNHVISHADWLGASNYGTYRQLLIAAEAQQALVQDRLPQHIETQIHRGVLLSRTNVKTTVDPTMASPIPWTGPYGTASVIAAQQRLRPLHGVRAGTTASLHRQGDRYFRLGMGGARIPVSESEIISAGLSTEDSIMPDDSASQVHPVTGYGPRYGNDSKDDGFW